MNFSEYMLQEVIYREFNLHTFDVMKNIKTDVQSTVRFFGGKLIYIFYLPASTIAPSMLPRNRNKKSSCPHEKALFQAQKHTHAHSNMKGEKTAQSVDLPTCYVCRDRKIYGPAFVIKTFLVTKFACFDRFRGGKVRCAC